MVSLSDSNDFGGSLAYTATLQQGSATQTFRDNVFNSHQDSLLTLQTSSELGTPFQEALTVSAYASSPGSQKTSANVQFLGLFDVSGNPVPFTVIPEPNTAILAGLLLPLIIRKTMLN